MRITVLLFTAIHLCACQSVEPGTAATAESVQHQYKTQISTHSLSELLEAIESAPTNRELLAHTSHIAEQSGQNDLAVNLLMREILVGIEMGDQGAIPMLNERMELLYSSAPDWIETSMDSATAVDIALQPSVQELEQISHMAYSFFEQGEVASAIDLQTSLYEQASDLLGEFHWTTISAQRDLGSLWQYTGDMDQAADYFKHALSSAETVLGKSHPNSLEIQSLLVALQAESGQYSQAWMSQRAIINAYESSVGEFHPLTLRARYMEIQLLEDVNKPIDAEEALKSLCSHLEEGYGRYHPESMHCLTKLATSMMNSGELEASANYFIEYLDRQKELAQFTNTDTTNALLQLADIRRKQGYYDDCEEILSALLVTGKHFVNSEAVLVAKSYLARLKNSRGDYDTAEQITLEVLREAEEFWGNQPINILNVSLELASIYQNQGKLKQAELVFEEAAYRAFELLGQNHPSTLVALSNLGQVYELLGKFDLAEQSLEEALRRFDSLYGPDSLNSANVRNNLALVYESQGNFREAEPLYSKTLDSLKISRGYFHTDTLSVVNNLAYLYALMGEHERAMPLFELAETNWTKIHGRDHQKTLKASNNLARSYQKLGKLEVAEKLFTETLQSRQENLGLEHIDTLRSMIDLGALYISRKQFERAQVRLEAALRLAENLLGDHHPYTFEALNHLANLYEQKKDDASALKLMETGFNRRNAFLERMLWVAGEESREGYLRLHQPELNQYLSLLSRTGSPEKAKLALNVSLERKGLLLKISSEIEQLSQISNDPAFTEISQELTNVRSELARLTLAGPKNNIKDAHANTLYELEQKLANLQAEIGSASVRYNKSIARINADLVSHELPGNTALVDFMMYEDKGSLKMLATVLVNNGNQLYFQLVDYQDRPALEQAVLGYRAIIQDLSADEDELLESGQRVFNLLWEPLLEPLNGIVTIHLVPDGVLNILPFDALVHPDGRYLIQTHILKILTSARDLVLKKKQTEEGAYVIFSGPNYNAQGTIGEEELGAAYRQSAAIENLGMSRSSSGLRGISFMPLPGAEEEGQIISTIIGQHDQLTTHYSGNDAQEIVLGETITPPKVLHIATHGFFLEQEASLSNRLLKQQRSIDHHVPPPTDNPLLRAGLAFAGINVNAPYLGDIDNRNDGVLTALEILALNLNGTHLVVLSACETGLGEIHEGEGVYGLRRSFQEAGAIAVVSSLWEVSDAGTQVFMTRFYDHLLSGMPAQKAIRKVQLELIGSYEWGYPYVWSAFMLVGGR